MVKQVQNMVYKWWNIDIGIIDIQSLADQSLASLQKYPFKNPLIKNLFQNDLLSKSFVDTLLFYQKKSKLPTSLMEKWSQTGLQFLLIPLHVYNQLTGFVVGVGFSTLQSSDPKVQANIKKIWMQNDFSTEWCEKHLSQIPFISPHDKKYFIDCVELIAQEILSVQQEITDKSQIPNIQKTPNNLSYGQIVGSAPVMLKLFNFLEQIKHSQNTVLIQGENGTGKELIARSIHESSNRKHQAFVVQNCAALNDNLLESELFGHVKGAFTGAYRDKPGLFETAHKGTFFLDEIGDTSQSMQVKLLRVIQDGTFFPVGGVQLKKVDVRIITATNKNLKELVASGKFREDLYYRLNVIHIQAPALRDRKTDIPLLAEFFINRISSQPKMFTKKAMNRLLHYAWPGNVRELQNEAERLAIFSSKNTYIKEEFLSDKIKNREDNQQLLESLGSHSGKIMKKAISKLESQLIARYLKEQGWNKTRTAKKLGISRAALVAKVKDYQLEKRILRKPLKQSS